MTKKDFELIAASINRTRMATSLQSRAERREAGDRAIRLAAIDLAASLRTTNPQFDRSRFLAACGYDA